MQMCGSTLIYEISYHNDDIGNDIVIIDIIIILLIANVLSTYTCTYVLMCHYTNHLSAFTSIFAFCKLKLFYDAYLHVV